MLIHLNLDLINYDIYRLNRSRSSSLSTRRRYVFLVINKKCFSSQIDIDVKSLKLCFIFV